MEERSKTAAADWCVLDDIDKFISNYLSATDQQRHAMILYGSASWIISLCATFPRLLFASTDEESGKTLAMMITACLCPEIIDGAGTSFDLIAALAEASMEPEKLIPTIIRDEISDVFGRSGTGGSSNNPLADVLRRGYRKGATRGRSRNGVSQRYNIFTPFIMTGLRTAVPRDIRTRCIVITMKPGIPREYFDVRDGEADAMRWGRVLGKEVREHIAEIAAFRVRNLGIPELRGRKGEVWEPLFAVAQAVGGPRWLAKAISAFRALALSELDQPELNPRQVVVKAVADIAPLWVIDGFVPGMVLADELRRTEEPMFKGRSELSVAKLISEQMPMLTVQRQLPSGDRMRGYYLKDIEQAWEEMRPLSPEELEPQEEENPFAVTDEDDDDEQPDTADTADTGKTAGNYSAPARARGGKSREQSGDGEGTES